jgi:zinc ribbon protein
MRENLGRHACPHCGADNPIGEMFCSRCGRRLPRTPAELREETLRRLAAERNVQTRRRLATAAVLGLVMGVGLRILADAVPQDIVGMSTLVEFARLFWWLAALIWGAIFWLALSSGRV